MAGTLIVDPAVYGAASSTVGVLAGGSLRSAAHGVLDVLSGAGGMAGSDPAAARWAAAYDDATASVVETSQRLINGGNVLAELLEQTGYNYARAELASAGAPPPLDRTDYLARAVSLTAPPSAAGSSPVGPPTGWSLIESAVGRVWPNGHQGHLRRAAAAWHDGACFLYDAAHYLADAVAQVAQQVAPETDAVIAVCNSLRDGIESAAEIYKALGVACANFAADIDQARSAAERELASLLEWTAGIEIAGAALTVLTFGASEVVSQGAVIARIGVTAARVAAIIDRLMVAAADAAEVIGTVVTRSAEIARRLNPIRQMERVASAAEFVQEWKVAATRPAFAVAPRVYGQLRDARLGALRGKLTMARLRILATRPGAGYYYDLRSGRINVIQEVDGVLLRITTPLDASTIISVGRMRPNQVTNLVARGLLVPIGGG